MIGERYWSTGIRICYSPLADIWTVWLEFFDDGFAEDGSTEGTLRVRYQAPLQASIDLLKADAERLGLVWRDPTVYYEADGIGATSTDWARDQANTQSERLGWRPVYVDRHEVGKGAA